MSLQSAKTPTPRESVTVTITLLSNEHYLLLGIIEAVTECVFSASSPSDVDWLEPFVSDLSSFRKIRDLNFKLQDSVFKSGDACRHSAQSSDAVGQGGINSDLPLVGSDSLPMVEYYQDQIETYGLWQGGTITCHVCEGQGTYTKINSSKLFECEWCRGTGLRSVDSFFQGGNQ